MNFSLFSLLMSVLFSTVFILMIHGFRNRPFFLRSFGVHTLLIMYGMCLFRMIFVIEMPIAVHVGIRGAFSRAYDVARQAQVPVGNSSIELGDALVGVWVIGAVILFFQLMWQKYAVRRELLHYHRNRNFAAERALAKAQALSSRKMSVNVCVCPDIDVPMGLGIFQRWVFLPDEQYSKEELFYIMAHEYTHFCNRDSLVKLLTMFLRCAFWWNPAFYLLKRDLDQILEIKCDIRATQDFSKKERLEYLLTIVRVLKSEPRGSGTKPPLSATGLLLRTEQDNIQERFELIVKSIKPIGMRYQVAFLSVALVVLFLSYTFVFQSAFDPPVEDIYTDSSVHVVEDSEWEITISKDKSYIFIDENGQKHVIDEKYADILISDGIRVKEE